MTLTYRYKEVYRTNNIQTRTPSIPMTLSGKGIKFEFTVLIDSGADISAIPKQVAELLGLDLSGKKEETFGIGGSASAVSSNIRIDFGKVHEKYSVDLPVKVILSDYDFPPLIGRSVFFDKFRITFDQAKFNIHLKANTNNNLLG
ncbi:MAG: retropepsin-like aspartic protease [Nanoarchaeota archaeon]